MKFIVEPNVVANTLTIKYDRLYDVVKVLMSSEKVSIEQGNDEIDEEEQRLMEELKEYLGSVKMLLSMMTEFNQKLTPFQQGVEERNH